MENYWIIYKYKQLNLKELLKNVKIFIFIYFIKKYN